MTRVAILQTGGVHEEVIPSLLAAMPEGAEAQVWIHKKTRDTRGDIFPEVGIDGSKIIYVTLAGTADWDRMFEQVQAFDPDVVLFSTFQHARLAKFGTRLGRPTIGLIHNARMAMGSPELVEYVEGGPHKILTLASHVSAALSASTGGRWSNRIGTLEPVYWGDTEARSDGPKSIVIPGGVSYKNRDFKGLLAALVGTSLAVEMRDRGVTVEVLGGGGDRKRLEDEIASANLGDVLTCAPLGGNGRVLYADYVTALRRAWALLPLLPLSKVDYRKFKITSAVPTAMAFGLPMVLDHWTETVYRVPALTADIGVEANLRALLALSDEDHTTLSEDVIRYRDRALLQNRGQMRRLLADQMS